MSLYTIVRNSELDSMLRKMILSNHSANFEFKIFFEVLYNTGCRPSELVDIERWKITSKDHVGLITAKTEAKRYLKQSLFPDIFLAHIGQQIPIFTLAFLQKARRHYRQFCPAAKLKVKNKSLNLYAYRHNRAKKEYEKKQDIEKVMEFFAWKNESTAKQYIFSQIYDRQYSIPFP